MEYLYSQTGKALTPVLQNPLEEINVDDIQDEGFEEENTEDITVPVLHEDDPSRQLPSSLMTSPQASPPQAPASPDDLPSTSRDGGQHPTAAPSVLPDTSQAALDSDNYLSNEAQLWTALPDCDKKRVDYQPRHQGQLPHGRYKAPKRSGVTPGVEC
ncbi:unnamed protein product [Merluccius merluccius]